MRYLVMSIYCRVLSDFSAQLLESQLAITSYHGGIELDSMAFDY